MKRSFVGHADLARVLSLYPHAPRSMVAAILGFEDRPVESIEQDFIEPIGDMGVVEGAATRSLPESTGPWPATAEECRSWKATRFELRDVKPLSQALAESPAPPERPERAKHPPSSPSLCPWPVLIPRLRSGLQPRMQAGRIDWDRVVDLTARGLFVRRLPCRSLKRWGESVLIVLDRSERLIPYFQDQREVLKCLKRIVPEHGLMVVGGSYPGQAAIRDVAEARQAATVLVLGDLGCLEADGEALRDEWRSWGESLRERGSRPLALVPCALECIPATLQQTFAVSSWQRLPHVHLSDPDVRREAVERLLGLVSPAIRLEPGLLREIRALLPGPGDAAADVTLESELWRHPGVVSRHVDAATLCPEQATNVWLPRFEREKSTKLRRKVLQAIRGWRLHLSSAVWAQEFARLTSASRDLLPTKDQDRKQAELELTQLWTEAMDEEGKDRDAVLDYFTRAWPRINHVVRADPVAGPIFRQAYLKLYPDDPLPEGWDPAEADRGATTLTLEIRQQGSKLVFTPAQLDDALLPVTAPVGSPFGLIRTTNRQIGIVPLETFWEGGTPAPWADDWGRDDYGPWATFRIGAVTQRLRWVQPGRFWMGSPESEEGRWEDEGPRHEVEIARGFWIFDAPCTQELWEAVTGKNPSHFKGKLLPVETVSWEDCQEFVGKLNSQFEGLECRLPSEAQWEYACRAGTVEPRYGKLDEVAWYYDNSGSTTHDVQQKMPNLWGLFDMLGNVWEWCHDGMRTYTNERMVDPLEPTEAGAVRVIRGGGWNDFARYVRAADRYAIQPGHRFNALGFRCLSSGRFFPAEAEPAAEVGGRKAEPGHQPEQAGGAVVVRVQENDPGKCQLPPLPRILIRSDLEDLILESAPRPDWAVSFGRDKYGMWADFEIPITEKTVVQRMRWVPPGRFLMGPPETEPGRYDDEGPQHEVVISHGYWLFDTPCTQVLWEAVMGKNPSRFQDPQRPVEQVSFEDVQGFLTKVNELVDGVGLNLPTESQWEYACRAGTTTPTYAGDVEIVGANNAPGLDAIAWYGGNSGHEFDLAEGFDSSDWPEKQYLHTRAGTRKVGQKRPNAWGLYDMLGNVWEWCLDGRRDYTKDRQTDPVGSMGAGAVRVIRGGGWGYDARYVRAAIRYAIQPDDRFNGLGFRCLSSGRS